MAQKTSFVDTDVGLISGEEIDGYGVVNGLSDNADKAQSQLVERMLAYMRQGWIPQGGVSVAVVSSGNGNYVYVCCQAIVRMRSSGSDV